MLTLPRLGNTAATLRPGHAAGLRNRRRKNAIVTSALSHSIPPHSPPALSAPDSPTVSACMGAVVWERSYRHACDAVQRPKRRPVATRYTAKYELLTSIWAAQSPALFPHARGPVRRHACAPLRGYVPREFPALVTRSWAASIAHRIWRSLVVLNSSGNCTISSLVLVSCFHRQYSPLACCFLACQIWVCFGRSETIPGDFETMGRTTRAGDTSINARECL